MIEIKDIVTLSDKNTYQVISKTDYEYRIYYYLVDINDISNAKFLYENNDKLTEVEDPDLVQRIMPFLYNEIKDLL